MAELTQDADRPASAPSTTSATSAPPPSMAPVCPASASAVASFTPLDRRMRTLLRVGDQVDPSALLGAQKAMSKSIFVSALRCTITYLLIPLLGSTIAILDAFSAPLSIVLCLFAGFMSIRSMRRFWIANHPKRWAYTAFASVVLVSLTVGIVVDVLRIINR
jgi:hypothetical protein